MSKEASGCDAPDSADIPTYESNATPEEREQALKLMTSQIQLILDQEKDDIPSKYTKIRCGCNKLVAWKFMYRCLYCGVWFCKDCAEQHFGFKTANN